MATWPRAQNTKPCSTGCGRPSHARTLCKACYDRDLKERNPEYAARQLAQAAAHQASQAGKDYRRARGPRKLTPEQLSRKSELTRQRKYGLNPSAYEALELRSGGLCESCQRPGKLVVDHDHRTGKVRGLLCRRCNTGVGFFEDNPETLERLAAYLRG
jgi:hypothetical protein